MALAEDIERILEDFGTKTKDDLQQSLRNKGVTFGGGDSRLSNKIKFEIVQRGDALAFKLIMPEYAEAVDKGRKAAGVSKEGRANIANWAKRKAIAGKIADASLKKRLEKQSEAKADNRNRKKWKKLKKPSFDKQLKAAVYLVTRKLKAKGFKGNQFYSEVVEDGRLDKLKKDLASALKTNIEIEIINLANI